MLPWILKDLVRALAPDPGGSRLHRLVIRHQGDVMHPIMSEKFTLEILHFLKIVGPGFSKLFLCKERTRALAPQPAGFKAWAQYIFASE